MEQKVIAAEVRSEKGKNVNRRLRNAGLIPTVLYSHGKAEELTVKLKDLHSIFHGHITESVIFGLEVPGRSEEILAFVKDSQVDPVSGALLHLDLFRVTRGEKIQTTVPVELIGTPVGLKMGGQLETGDREIHIECLPKDLPGKIEVDVTKLNVGDSIHAGDIDLGAALTLIGNSDSVIASVHETRVSSETEGEEEDVTAEVEESEE